MNAQSHLDHEDTLGFLIGRARRTIGNQINRFFVEAEIDLNLEQWIILKKLWEKDGQTQQLLATNVYKDKASIARTLGALIRKNFIVKVPDKIDKRSKLIYLTHKGKNMKAITMPHIHRLHELASEGIPKKDLETCKKVLVKVFENIITVK